MKFPVAFKRTKGGGTPALGGDSLPSGPPSATADNVLSVRAFDARGWPIQRVAVALVAPNGSAAVPCSLYFYEQALSSWVQLGAAVSVTPGTLAYFDGLCLVEPAQAFTNQGNPTAGNPQFLLIASDPGAGAPSGAYSFAMAGISNTP